MPFLIFSYCLVASFSENIVTEEVPADMVEFVTEKRRELIEVVSEVDDKLAEAFLNDEPISPTDLEVLWIKFKRKKLGKMKCVMEYFVSIYVGFGGWLFFTVVMFWYIFL